MAITFVLLVTSYCGLLGLDQIVIPIVSEERVMLTLSFVDSRISTKLHPVVGHSASETS